MEAITEADPIITKTAKTIIIIIITIKYNYYYTYYC